MTTLRNATRDEMQTLIDWAAAEGWNPGLGDASAFYAADPAGFFVADVAGEVGAAISVVNHSLQVSFLGLYICRPDLRGSGLGYALWNHALRHAGERSVGLDGVAAQQANYAKSGFVFAGSTVRFEGVLAAKRHSAVRLATEADDDVIQALDTLANGYGRPEFLTAWKSQSDVRRTILISDGADTVGFATARQCRSGIKIGPVIAPDIEAALCLAEAAAAEMNDTHVTLDIPSGNSALIEAISGRGFRETFRTARMFRGPLPETTAALQAIGTMELG